MNYNKVIKDLKERNNKLENQRRQFELNYYHEKHIVEKQDKEIERLNNIINELEKVSDEIFHKYPYERHQWFLKLKELKEGKDDLN